jgi:hypothetical protein
LKEIDRLIRPAFLLGDHSEQTKRIHMPGLLGEQLPVNSGGFRGAARAMMLDCGANRLFSVELGHAEDR